MRSILFTAALATAFAVAASHPAEAWWRSGGVWHGQRTVSRVGPGQWTHSGSVTGPRGRTGAFAGTTSCGGGTCNRGTTFTGPNGRVATGSTTVTHTAPGQFSSSHTLTGPNGNAVTHSGSTACADSSCTHTGTWSRE